MSIQVVFLLSVICSVMSIPPQLQYATILEDQEHSDVSGSVMGGQPVYIRGTGFDPIAANNEVWLGDYPCPIPAEGVTDSFITCETVASGFNDISIYDLPIKVKVNGQQSTVKKDKYHYKTNRTPKLYEVYPNSAPANTRLHFKGVHRVSDTGDSFRDMGDFILFAVGDKLCQLFDIKQNDNVGYHSFSYVQCDQSTEQEAGYYLYQEKVSLGFADIDYKVTRSSLDNKLFHHTVMPIITDINPNSGYTGGQYLSIGGYGFSPQATNNEVTVDGVPCEITESSYTSIKCKLSRKTTESAEIPTNSSEQQNGYLKGSGFYYQRYYVRNVAWNSKIFKQKLEEAPEQLQLLQSGYKTTIYTDNVLGEYYGQVWKGYFYAPNSGVYTFRGTADDNFDLFMADTYGSTEVGEEPFIYLESWIPLSAADRYYYDNQTSAMGSRTLQGGKYYYMQLYMVNWAGPGYMKMSVEVPNTSPDLIWPTHQVAQIQTEILQSQPEIWVFELVGATGGSFTLNYREVNEQTLQVTQIQQQISVDASANDFKNALKKFFFFSYDMDVTKQVRDESNSVIDEDSGYKVTWTAEINSLRSDRHQEKQLSANLSLTQGQASFSHERTQEHSPYITGSFSLMIGGHSILINGDSKIPHNAADWQLRIAINQIEAFKYAEVYRVGNPSLGCKWVIEFLRYHDDVPDIEVTSFIKGGVNDNSATASFHETRKFSTNLLFNPMNENFMFAPAEKANVLVKVNDILAISDTDTSYQFTPSPQITKQERDGSSVTINLSFPIGADEDEGEESNPSIEQVTVIIDGKECIVEDGGSLEIFICNIPTNENGEPAVPAGQATVEVSVEGEGVAEPSDDVEPMNFPLTLSSLNPASGGTNGGYPVEISGSGFPTDPSLLFVSLCGSDAQIVSVSSSAVTFIAPICSSQSKFDIIVSFEDLSQSIQFQYTAPSLLATITGISPTSASPVLKSVMTISGNNFGDDSSSVSVHLTNSSGKVYEMKVLTISDEQIECGIPGGLPGDFTVEVTFEGQGNALVQGNSNQFTYQVNIVSISPTSGSYYGGTLITISGENFAPDKNQILAFVGNQINWFCTTQTVSSTEITCRTPPFHEDWADDRTHSITVTNRLIIDAQCTGSCDFTYNTQAQAMELTSISSTQFTTNDVIRVQGTNLNKDDLVVVLRNQQTAQVTIVPVDTNTNTQVEFTVPSIEAGSYKLSVRKDPEGQSNTVQCDMKVSAENYFEISEEGGPVTFEGKGFPSAWPHSYIDLVLQDNDLNMNIDVDVVSTSPTSMVIRFPSGRNDQKFFLDIWVPSGKQHSIQFRTKSRATPQLTLTNQMPVETGALTLTLTRENLSTKDPSEINLVHAYNPSSSYPCTNIQTDEADVTCDVDIGSGMYSVQVYYEDVGYGRVDKEIQVNAPSSYSVNPKSSSWLGGKIQVTGDNINENAVLRVGEAVGKVVSVSENSALFEIPPLLVKQIKEMYPKVLSTGKIPAKDYISDSHGQNPEFIGDDRHTSFYISDHEECMVGIDIGEGKAALLERVRYFPQHSWHSAQSYLKGGVFEASVDGQSYTQIGIVEDSVHVGWNSILIDDDNHYRYVRFLHNQQSYCQLGELEIHGVLYDATTINSVESHQADIVIDDGHNSYFFQDMVNYGQQYTPVISEVTPATGDVFGGYDITLKGSNLDIGVPSVVIDGVDCQVKSSSASEIVCEVGERLNIPQKNDFVVEVDGSVAYLEAKFMYVMRWSDSRTWGTDLPPVEGDLVYVPSGMTLYVDQSTPRLDGIIVEDGSLIFADEGDYQIHANLITVNGGVFQAGTQSQPYEHKLTFIMYGGYYGKQQPIVGNKGITCIECKLSMYGEPRVKTWTLINSNIQAGDSQFEVLEEVDWKAGETIVVASSDLDHRQAEERQIDRVEGKTVYVTEPFKYVHYGEQEQYGSNILNLRAEVGLLTRNIKMMGDQTSTQTEYGSHLMMVGSAEDGMVAHVAYTEFTHCGQPRIVGRYCIHFHMNGDVIESYAIGNAVHHSFARVITVHAVHYLRVFDNVGYWVKGHNYFIEDGIETHNILEGNLAISSLQSWNMLQTDISVSSFWITNPSNHFRHNRAAGSDFYGFWYEIKPHPDGPSSTQDICPQGNVLGDNSDNLAHSNKRFGVRIFKLAPREKPCQPIDDEENPSVQSIFRSFTLFKNKEAGLLAEETGNMIFENFTIAENVMAGMEFYRTNRTSEKVIARDMAIIGRSRTHPPSDPSQLDKASGVITPRTSGWEMEDIRFYNFDGDMVITETCSKCDIVYLFTNTAQTYEVQKIEYHNITSKKLLMNGLQRDIIYDLDGSFSEGFYETDHSSASILHNFPHLQQDGACHEPSDEAWGDALLCTDEVVRVMFTNIESKNMFKFVPMKVQLLESLSEQVEEDSQQFTEFVSFFDGKQPMIDKTNAWAMPFLAGRVYHAWWLTGLHFTHLAIDVKSFTDEDTPGIIFKFNYTEHRELFEVAHFVDFQLQEPLIPQAGSQLDPESCQVGEFNHDNAEGNRYMAICLSGRGKAAEQEYLDINPIICRDFCPEDEDEDEEKENFFRLWSNASQWPGGVMPQSGDNITVEKTWNLKLDMNPEPIEFLQIEGDLIIPDEIQNDFTIEAESIWVKGAIIAGSEDTPYEGKIKFVINGNKNDGGYVFTPQFAGNKHFVVSGSLELYGETPETTWTMLEEFAEEGDTSIMVGSTEGWEVGDEIVLGPSFNDPSEHELVTITGISTNEVTFTPALQHNHYGSDSVTIENSYGSLDTRTAVGHLSRKIKIMAGDDSGWGFRLLAMAYRDSETNDLKEGQIILQGVEFYEGGQYDTEYSALQIRHLIGDKQSRVTKSSFHDCKSFCLDISNSKHIQISNNVFYKGRLFHVRALSVQDYQFMNNLMIAATRRPTMDADVSELIACYGSWEYLSKAEAQVENNLCQGSDLHGFAIGYIPCDEESEYPYKNNTVGSAEVGWIFEKANGGCQLATGIKAYACKIGQIASSPGTEELYLKNFMVGDSGRALTLRFGKEGDDRTAYLINSWISAITRPTCSRCYQEGALDCKENHGIRMLAVTVNGERLPDKFGSGFDVICKQETFDAKAFLEDVQFENFNQQYGESGLQQCSSNVVFMPHSGASDMTGSHHLMNTICTNCSLNAYAFFSPPNPGNLGWQGGCGNFLCTGKNNYLIHDWSGSFLPEKGILLANNSVIGDNTEGCTYIEDINGHYCNRQDFGVIEYESIAHDFNTRMTWPVFLSYDGGNYRTKINAWRQWEWEGFQPLNRRLSRFVSVVELSRIYNITFDSEPPSDWRIQFQRRTYEGDNSEFILFKLHYPKPNSIRVMLGADIIKPIPLADNDKQIDNQTCGSNKFFYHNNSIHFVLTGHKDCQLRITLTNSIQLTTRFEMDINDFYDINGETKFIDRMCALLGIDDTSRLKIVSIREGSVEITTFIQPPTEQEGNVTEIEQMQELQQQITELASNNELNEAMKDEGFGELTAVETEVHVVEEQEQQDDDDDDKGPIDEEQEEQSNNLFIIGIVIGAAALIILVIILVCYYVKKEPSGTTGQPPPHSDTGKELRGEGGTLNDVL